jgi:hypothetical protein
MLMGSDCSGSSLSNRVNQEQSYPFFLGKKKKSKSSHFWPRTIAGRMKTSSIELYFPNFNELDRNYKSLSLS